MLLIIMNFVIAIICYSLVLQWMNIQHYKLCVAIKGGALAMAFMQFMNNGLVRIV